MKKETLAQVFSCEFCEIFKNTFFTEHFRETASVTNLNPVPCVCNLTESFQIHMFQSWEQKIGISDK